MSLIDEIATVNITMGDLGINTASYDTLLIIGSSNTAKNPFVRVATYGNMAAVAIDYLTTSPEYKAASVAFSQLIQPVRIKIGQLKTVNANLEAYDVGYNAIKAADNNWYGVVITSRTAADQLLISSAVGADNKLFGTSSDDVKTLTPNDTTTIAYRLSVLKSDRTFCIYSSTAATVYPEAALLGLMLSYAPGSANWAHRQIQGIAGEIITDTGRTAIEAINCNFIGAFAGRNISFWGTSVSGQYIDLVVGKDWLKTTLQARVASVLQDVLKVEQTDTGVQQITTAIKAVLYEAAEASLIDKDTIKVTAPLVESVNATYKANRILPDVYFEAVLSGAVNKVKIEGTLSI